MGKALGAASTQQQLGKWKTALSSLLTRIQWVDPFVRRAAIVTYLRAKVDIPLPLLEEIAGYLAIATPVGTKSLAEARIPASAEFSQHLKLAIEHIRFRMGHIAQDPGFQSESGSLLQTSPSLLQALLWLGQTHHLAVTCQGQYSNIPVSMTLDSVVVQSQELQAQMETLLAACSTTASTTGPAIDLAAFASSLTDDLVSKPETCYLQAILRRAEAVLVAQQLGGRDVLDLLRILLDLAKPTASELLPGAIAWLNASPEQDKQAALPSSFASTYHWLAEQAARAFAGVDFNEGRCTELIAQLGCYALDEIRPVWQAEALSASPVYCLQALMAGSDHWELLQAQLPLANRYCIGELMDGSDPALVLPKLQALQPLDDVARALQWRLLHEPTHGDLVPWLEVYAPDMRFVMDVDGTVFTCPPLALGDVLALGVPRMVAGALVSELVDAQHATSLIEVVLENTLQEFFAAAQVTSEAMVHRLAKWLLSVLELLPVVTAPLLGTILLKPALATWGDLKKLLPTMVISHRQAKSLHLVGLAHGVKEWQQLPEVAQEDMGLGLFSLLAEATSVPMVDVLGYTPAMTEMAMPGSGMSSAVPSRTVSAAQPTEIQAAAVHEDVEEVYEAIRRRLCVYLDVLASLMSFHVPILTRHGCRMTCLWRTRRTSPRCAKSLTTPSLVCQPPVCVLEGS